MALSWRLPPIATLPNRGATEDMYLPASKGLICPSGLIPAMFLHTGSRGAVRCYGCITAWW